MKVLILAAGYGTRLYPIVKNTAKAMLEINGKSLVDYILERVRGIEHLSEVILVTNDKFYNDFVQWAAAKNDDSLKIRVVNDGTKSNDDRLGSIGDIHFVLNQGIVDEDLLVVGGDNLFDFNINDYFQFAKAKEESVSIGVYDIHDISQADKFGVVEVDQNQKVVSFEEKPKHPKSSLIAMCFYYFPKKTLGLLSKYLLESKKSDKAGDYIKWLHENGDVYGYEFRGKWFDIGSIESYEEAQKEFKS